MSCSKTQHLLTEYFSDELTPLTRDGIDKHLRNCQQCREELGQLVSSRNQLLGWEEQRVPFWDRGVEQYRKDHRIEKKAYGNNWVWQWVPGALSFAMLVLVFFNVGIRAGEDGVTIAFGAQKRGITETEIEARLASFSSEHSQQQNQQLQDFLTRMDERQDSNNLRLMQAVMEQGSQMNSESFAQMYSYFEQQRQLDLQSVQFGYQQLVDSDFETIQTMQQLANFVRYQSEVR